MREKVGRFLKKIIWVPLVLGMIGYYVVEGLPFWMSLYASGALYFVNPVSDAENIWITLAKISAMIVATGVILSFLSSLYRAVERLIALSFSDSTAV